MNEQEQPMTRRHGIPAGIWAIGFVSLLMDISSEMIHALLPVYMVTMLGTSVLTVGVIEGIAEATASIVKVFSGTLSDWLGKRKLLAVIGYGLAAITKPVFPLAATIEWLIAARFVDRIGKGIRGAPRDALVADIAPPHLRGASFGLRQSLDTVGAFLGPLLAMGLMMLTTNNFKAVFWWAVIPAFLAVGMLVFAVREPKRQSPHKRAHIPVSYRELGLLSTTYWWIVAIAAVFTLARFSEAFLVLRAQSVNVPVAMVPIVMIIMSVAYALSAYPVGALSDRISRLLLLAVGMVVLLAADMVLAFASDFIEVGIGVMLWGLHMGVTQGLLSSLVAHTAPAGLRGTAFGIYNLVTGLVLLFASVIAGIVWDIAGPQGTFLAGVLFSFLALMGLLAVRNRLKGMENN